MLGIQAFHVSLITQVKCHLSFKLQLLTARKKDLLVQTPVLQFTKQLVAFRGTGSFTRRSCQTVLAAHLLSIVRVLAPVLPHLAEDVWQHLPFELTSKDGLEAKFVIEGGWPEANERWQAFPVDNVEFWRKLLEVESYPVGRNFSS